MHDIGHSQSQYWQGETPPHMNGYAYPQEYEAGGGAYEAEGEYGPPGAFEMPGESEAFPQGEGMFGEYQPLGEYENLGEYGSSGSQEVFGQNETLFNEADEIQLASELLSTSNEQELEQFIGDLLRKATQLIGGALPGPVAQSLGGLFRNVAKQALPVIGGALGNIVAPGVGGVIGSQLAGGAGQLLGLEMEGLSLEDREFEAARRIVRLGGAAVENAATAPPSIAPEAIAQSAIEMASRVHAPGLAMQPMPMYGYADRGDGGPSRNYGRWYRRGNRIVLVGA